jgi:hypothetical protein
MSVASRRYQMLNAAVLSVTPDFCSGATLQLTLEPTPMLGPNQKKPGIATGQDHVESVPPVGEGCGRAADPGPRSAKVPRLHDPGGAASTDLAFYHSLDVAPVGREGPRPGSGARTQIAQ